MDASLAINKEDNEIVINLKDSSVVQKAQLRFAITDWNGEIYNSSDDSNSSIIIPIIGMSDSEIKELYIDIRDVFNDLNLQLDGDSESTKRIDEIEIEEKEFIRRCSEAKNVWNGDLNVEDFKSFTSFVQNNISRHFFYDGLDKKQLLSSYYLAATSCGCNFSVPGAGKTVCVWTTYAYLNSLPENDPRHVNALFVVGPIACFGPWEDEYEKCFNRPVKSIRFLSSINIEDKKRITKGITHRDTELYLSHFQTFSIYQDLFEDLFKRPDKKIMLVIDEAHNIKGQDGVWANAVLKAAPFVNSRIILTGTPAPNGYEDLKNLFDFIHPGRNIIGFNRQQLRLMSESKLPTKELSERVKPFYIRIKKSELDIPPATFNVLEIEMSVLQKKIYDEVESKFLNGKTQKLFKNGNLIRLRQAASNPLQLMEPLSNEIYENDYDEESEKRILEVEKFLINFDYKNDLPKLETLLNLVQDANRKNEKILIWTYFVSTAELICKYLTENFNQSQIFKITGATPVNDKAELEAFNLETELELSREKILKQFRGGDYFSALVATPQCIGESISLHMECHKAVYYDRDFNCGLFIQSKDRIHRKGLPQNINTNYFYLISKDSVDEQINYRLEEKENRMIRLIESNEIPFLSGSFDRANEEDIKSVIEAYYAKQL